MMKAAVVRTPILAFILMFFALGYTIAHNKVVVVPLGSVEPTLDIYYGSISSIGVLETGNIVSAVRTSTGRYTLDLGREASGCAPSLTIGTQAGGSSNIRGNSTVSVSGIIDTLSVRLVGC